MLTDYLITVLSFMEISNKPSCGLDLLLATYSYVYLLISSVVLNSKQTDKHVNQLPAKPELIRPVD